MPRLTVVVCRTEHLREAAIVLSCIASAERGPLIVLERPPSSQSEYRSLYAAYRAMADVRDRSGAVAPSPGAVDALSERLTPYRQWAKHQAFIAELLERLNPARAVFLFLPDDEDTSYLDPLARHRLSDQQHPIVPESAARLYFLPHDAPSEGVASAASSYAYTTLTNLSELAWTSLRQSSEPCANAIEISEDDVAGYFTGLYRAFQGDVALRPVASRPASDAAPAVVAREANASVYCDPPAHAPNEAVLVECTNDAERLIGVQYAHRREARLVVITEPDGAPIEAARAAVERRSASALPAGLTEEQIVAAVRASLFDDRVSALLRALEEAVTAQLPPAAIEAVGALALTALTTSTPYNFVSTNGVSWAEKPIGHVAGDISLLLLADMYPASEEVGVGFNLLFDPGYISTTETTDVLSDLQAGSSYSLLLAGLAGATLALTYLAPTLPIDLLFFNTHGSENGIKLADMPVALPAYKLVARTTLAGRPVVFNNSCLSWVGVGREFVRAGARGYIGTLWSVHDAQAAEYAKKVIARMLRAGEPVSAAMRDTGVDAVDARAYIFVGTASAKRQERPLSAAGGAQRLLRASSFMLEAVAGLLDEAAGSLTNPYIGAIADNLVAAAEAALATIDGAMPRPSQERIDDALTQMRIYAAFVERDEKAALKANQFFVRWIDTLNAVPDETSRDAAKARLLLFASRIPARVGPWRQAVAALEQSIAASLAAGETPLQQYLELCDACIAGGLYPQAREGLEAALRCYAARAISPDAEVVVRQSRVALCYGASPDALRLAGIAFAAADAGDDLRSRASAKIAETNAYLALGDWEHALVSARAADDYARLAYDDELQLGANEVLATALLQNEGLSEARDLATNGLERAKTNGWTLAIAAHAEVSGDIALRSDHPVQAIVAWCGAAWMYVKVGRPVFEARLLQKVKVAALDLGTSNVAIQFLRLGLGVVDDFEAPLRAAVAHQYVAELGSLVTRFGVAPLRSDLEYLRTEMNAIVAARGAGASEELKYMANMTVTLIAGSDTPSASSG